MTSKIRDGIRDLDSMLSSMCYPVDREVEDDILIKSLSKLLPPDSSWSIFLDIREIAEKSKKSLKSCPHSLRLLRYHEGDISFVCHTCNNNLVEGSEPEPLVEEEESPSHLKDIGKNAESSPPSSSQEKTESDEEIDQLLMDTPEKEKDENNSSSGGTNETSPSLNTGLKLRDLSELLETTSALPTFSSSRLEEGINPMQSIPVYQADLTLTDEISAGSPPGPVRPVRHQILVPSVSSAPLQLRTTVRPVRTTVTRPPSASMTVASSHISLPSQVQLQPQAQVQSLSKTQPGGQPGRVSSRGPGQYVHYLSNTTEYVNQASGGGKVRAKWVTVPRPSGQPYPQPSPMMPSSGPLQSVQYRAPPQPQVIMRNVQCDQCNNNINI